MIAKVFLTIISICLLLSSSCGLREPVDPPKLVVIVTLDQFRAGYLERYDEVFKGGFRRMRDTGRRYDRAIVDHAATLSFPGHATLATGAHPKTHGINTNSWLVEFPGGGKGRWLALMDTTCQIVGYPDLTGFSPGNLKVTGLADWIRAANPEARSVAVSTGTALAMAYGGRALEDESRNHAYWLSSSKGKFITSTFFRSDYPDWVASFNKDVLPWFTGNRSWNSTVPEEYRHLAREDATPYEGDGIDTAFPHVFEDPYETEEENARAYNRWFFNGPFADDALFALAQEAVNALELGQRGATDFLSIAVKSVDRIGHDYGPRSQEQLDILLRLDWLLGTFLSFLDETVGKDEYIIVLSADHGAPNIVEYELEQGRPGKRVTEEDIQNVLDDIERFVDAYDGPEGEMADKIARELERVDFIERAMTPEELAGTGPADEILRAYRNTYVPGRKTPFPLWTNKVLYEEVGDKHPANWGIIVEFAENAQLWTARSAHGSSYSYDREVPIIFMGRGVKPGIATGSARTIDVAPTLAEIAGIEYPATVDGTALDVN